MKVKVIGNIKGKEKGSVIDVKESVAINLLKAKSAEPVDAKEKDELMKKISLSNALTIKNNPNLIIGEQIKSLVDKVEKLEKIVKELSEKKK